ncbi:hypothetical protein NE237_031850 [Protea cynaroides]|uniref:Uncharacterized protein n=1 Tax=Protea cynaroides TaxID=273540 RepID=A0A9Q0R2J3_9MAGN|nr:hypothetical protein NE237_031850 [Protea cynaroides]
MKKRLRGKRVLLILDGIDFVPKFNDMGILFKLFDVGSKIFVTGTEKKNVRNAYKSFLDKMVYKVDDDRICRLPKLDGNQSFQLFNRRAFPNGEFREVLDKDVMETVKLLADGLPSYAVKLAHFLGGKITDNEVCQTRLNDLKNIPDGDLDQKIQKWHADAKKKAGKSLRRLRMP